MSQLTITISDKADALIAQLQKEIFNRRRKKVTAEGVVETLLESGAKSQSDKRFATSWENLIADIERAAKVAQAHGSKPSALSDEEWALVLSLRTRSTPASPASRAIKPRASAKAKAVPSTQSRRRPATAAKAPATEVVDLNSPAPTARSSRPATKAKPASKTKAITTTRTKSKAAVSTRSKSATRSKPAPSVASSTAAKTSTRSPSRAATSPSSRSTRSSVARRMAKAASRLGGTPSQPPVVPQASTAAAPGNGSNGVEAMLSPLG
ncbi:MAG: hypothetical protein ACKO5M_04845 [Vulcanococcus sp.]